MSLTKDITKFFEKTLKRDLSNQSKETNKEDEPRGIKKESKHHWNFD